MHHVAGQWVCVGVGVGVGVGEQHTMLVPVATRALPSLPHPLARRVGDHLSLWL
jgi:hypothetical protein